MKGIIVPTTKDENTGQHFGVRVILNSRQLGGGGNFLGSDIFPVPDGDIDVRDLQEGSQVVFHTERDSGQARIDQPPPVRGVRQERM